MKLAVIICVIGFFASLAFSLSFYFRDFPTRPQPELGRTYGLNNHGLVRYMNREEKLQEEVSSFVAVILGALAMIMAYFFDPFDLRKQQSVLKRRPPWNHP